MSRAAYVVRLWWSRIPALLLIDLAVVLHGVGVLATGRALDWIARAVAWSARFYPGPRAA